MTTPLAAARYWASLTKTQRRKLQEAPTEWRTLGTGIRWPTLRALLARGLVELERRPPRGPIAYRVTEFGREVQAAGNETKGPTT